MAKFANGKLAAKVAAAPKTVRKKASVAAIPAPDTKNIQGAPAYGQAKWRTLVTMLNTLKLENQYYRSEGETMKKLKALIDECASEDPYFVAQCVVYSRCIGEGMRSINHLAATYLAAYVGGVEWGKRFYGLYDKKYKKGGTIFRADDITEIVAAYSALNPRADGKNKAITNAMKRGFKSALEGMDSYALLKYKSGLLDVINLVRPNPNNSKAVVKHDGKTVSTFEAIIKGLNVSADTWEVAQSEAGQIVAEAVKEGKISKAVAAEMLTEAKSENWAEMLKEGKLGIMAAIRNIRNILLNTPTASTINALCDLIANKDAILKGKIMPYQLDMANEVLLAEFSDANSRKISQALVAGYENALPNLKDALSGDTLVIIDMSGSMNTPILDPKRKTNYKKSCLDKACLIGATIAKATNGDVIRFGDNAEYVSYNPNQDVFSLGKSLYKGMGCTSLALAWKVAAASGKKYTRVFILSDNECNRGSAYSAYSAYVQKSGDPYVYSVDLAGYGTDCLAGPKVRYYFGFGYSMFTDIATSEFNPDYHIEKIKSIVI
jgi:hypothetical protein